MSIIQGIEKISHQLDDEQLEQLENAAEIHKNQNNITFTIEKFEEETVYIETAQSETRSKKYASEATLVKRTHEVFDKCLAGFKIEVDPSAFMQTPTSVVNPAWLEKKMKEKGVRIKQIAFETGVDRDSISEWVTGKRSMSQIVKAMFYYYLSR
jgi:hypothetical protein